ncbi:hypothetical protein NXS19_002149 [Fusarium pseudograminearum]|nr:hypothetical protein NXS19_002149 [Fusarium pseudograminearum]
MSTHHQDNTTTEISSLEITPARPRQEGKLALLPSEILLKILNDTEITQKPVEQNPRLLHPLKNPGTIDVCTNVLSAPDVKNLALASSSLFYRLSPSFYLAGNCYAFRSAVKHADVDAMKRCAEFGAAPDMHWELEGECECRGEQVHLSHRPIDVLLEQVKSCSIPISKSIEALHWLLDNGHVFTPMEVAMMSHCPPHFLEVLLELYKRHDAHGQRTADTCPESMSRWVGWNPFEQDVGLRMRQEWMHGSDLGKLARNLFLDLLDPARDWKEEYHGETADIFTEKINLMEKYDFIDSSEIVALRCILRSLLRITSMAVFAEGLDMFAGGLDKARHGKHCFEIMISESLILIAPTLLGPYLSRYDYDEFIEMVSEAFDMYEKERHKWEARKLLQLERRQMQAFSQLRTLLVEPGEDEEEEEEEEEVVVVVEEGDEEGYGEEGRFPYKPAIYERFIYAHIEFYH